MVSKTRMTAITREFHWKEVRDGLAENTELLGVRDDRGRNWLHLCCSVDPKPKRLAPADSVETARVILEAGIDVNDEAFSEAKGWKATPLWFAIARGHNLRLAKYLLDHGSTPEYCIFAASYREDIEAVRLLVRCGASVDPTTHPESPLLGAIRGSRFRGAEALLEAGANVDFQNESGMTPLHYMLKNLSDTKHFRMLLQYGPRGDLPDKFGKTAAEIMSRKRDPELRKLAAQLATG